MLLTFWRLKPQLFSGGLAGAETEGLEQRAVSYFLSLELEILGILTRRFLNPYPPISLYTGPESETANKKPFGAQPAAFQAAAGCVGTEYSRRRPPLDVSRVCCTLTVPKMTTFDDRVRGMVTATLTVCVRGRCACRQSRDVDYGSRWCSHSRSYARKRPGSTSCGRGDSRRLKRGSFCWQSG